MRNLTSDQFYCVLKMKTYLKSNFKKKKHRMLSHNVMGESDLVFQETDERGKTVEIWANIEKWASCPIKSYIKNI